MPGRVRAGPQVWAQEFHPTWPQRGSRPGLLPGRGVVQAAVNDLKVRLVGLSGGVGAGDMTVQTGPWARIGARPEVEMQKRDAVSRGVGLMQDQARGAGELDGVMKICSCESGMRASGMATREPLWRKVPR